MDADLRIVARAALARLERERITRYADATHILRFPHAAGFTAEEEVQQGDVFVRAITADALCDARDAGLADLDHVLAEECTYLVHRRTRNGWSYFPELPELPADADDVAQVIQVLARCGRLAEVSAHVERSLALVLAHRSAGAEGIDTWIIPSPCETETDARQTLFAAEVWGRSVDHEVAANFGYALALYDRDRFAGEIAALARGILSGRQSDGSWRSTWYMGPFYGTLVCTRLLRAANPDAEAEWLTRVLAFLRATQHADGGWGLDAETDTLSTALALCTLASGAGTTAEAAEIARRGVQALAIRAREGEWQRTPFIVMHVGRARGQPEATLMYASETVAAAYTLKAAALTVCAGLGSA